MNQKNTSSRKLVAWLASFSLLLSVFAPMVTHTVAAKGTGVLVKICSVSGVRSIAVDTDHSTPVPNKSDHGNHCPYCVTFLGAAVPVYASANIIIPGASERTLGDETASNHKTTFLIAAAPRGPPSPSI